MTFEEMLSRAHAIVHHEQARGEPAPEWRRAEILAYITDLLERQRAECAKNVKLASSPYEAVMHAQLVEIK